MEALKRRRAELKRECKLATKDQKLLAAKRQRLLKARVGYCDLNSLARNSEAWQAAKGLSAADLQLLLNRAQGGPTADHMSGQTYFSSSVCCRCWWRRGP